MSKMCKKANYKIPMNPRFICKKCERKSKKKDKLCKPEKLKI